MSVCTQCGHELGVGRFCLNCGHAIDAPADVPRDDAPPEDDWRTGTAERPVVPAYGEPRYPLYADEATGTSTGSHRHVAPRTSRQGAWPPWLPGLLVAVVMLAFAGAGAWLLLRGDDDPATSATSASDTGSTSSRPTPTPVSPEPSPSKTDEPTGEPSDKPTKTPSAEPEEVAGLATVTVPATAPPNQDLAGNLVRYDGRNLLDGITETTWRMPGDGTGEALVLELAEPTTITSVGMVNGYAKTAQDGGTSFDWYAGNRRVLAVEWVFDDGTVVSQDLAETRDLQSVEVDAVTTESVELRLVTVSPPGPGSSARDYTAISEVSLLGTLG